MDNKFKLMHFPISFFSVILGLAGFTIALQKIEELLKSTLGLSEYALVFSVLCFLAISIVYLFKILRFPKEVLSEFHHPIKLSFFPTFSISLLLLSIAFLAVNLDISKYLWFSGTIIHFIFTLKIIAIWFHQSKFEIKHLSPAWFIPPVGNILIPIAGIVHISVEISWFFFSIGFFLWIILMVIFFNRIIFHHPMPDKLLPTLFILIAPPAVGFIAFVKLSGEMGVFATMLYYFALFLTLLLFSQAKMFFQLRYYLSWWAYSFPLSAITIASILMFHKTGSQLIQSLAFTFFTILTLLIVFLLFRTVNAMLKNEICISEEE
jgi:tellurite resistance protein